MKTKEKKQRQQETSIGGSSFLISHLSSLICPKQKVPFSSQRASSAYLYTHTRFGCRLLIQIPGLPAISIRGTLFHGIFYLCFNIIRWPFFFCIRRLFLNQYIYTQTPAEINPFFHVHPQIPDRPIPEPSRIFQDFNMISTSSDFF